MTFDFSTAMAGARFSNPILTASGCAGSGKELSQFFPLSELGAIVTKSIMVKPRSGRATPRMADHRAGADQVPGRRLVGANLGEGRL